jgi:predicted XRE-type DNA-binding protein
MEVEEESGNVVADLALPNSEERCDEAALTFRIAGVIRARRLTQVRAAGILKVGQPKSSLLLHGRVYAFFGRTTHAIRDVAWPRC